MNDESPNKRQPMPLELTGQQREVLEALKRKETEKYPLNKWYHGALYALHNHYNPDSISQAAQSLRELLEKLPRVVSEIDAQGHPPDFKEMRRKLHERFSKDKERYEEKWEGKEIDKGLDKTLRKLDNYLECNQQPTRREQMQTPFTGFDPVADQLGITIQQAKRDELHNLWQRLEGFAHHRSNPDIEKFREECLETLERIVFDLLASIITQDQREIQSILKRSDRSESDVERMLSLIERRGANFAFFFKHATDAAWIPVLKNRGYFARPPKIEPIDDNEVTFPFWWPILYLERVSITDPCLVVDTILGFQNTDNPRILHEITEIALKVEPIEQSLRLKDWVSKYLQSPYHLGASDLIKKLVNRWSGASTKKAMDAALNLVKTAVSFGADPESQDKQAWRKADPENWTPPLEPRPRFDKWEYQEILEKGVRPLSEKAPYQTAQILIDATATMICLQSHQDDLEKSSGNDSSIIWCPRVNEPSEDYQDSDESLVHTLTFACEKVYEGEPEPVSALDQALRKQRWDIFTRIRQYLYALYPNEQTKPWIRELILTHKDYDKWKHQFEFQRMIRLACENLGPNLLTTAEKERIFEAILSGPSEQDFRDWMGDRFNEEAFEGRKRYFHRMQLSPFASVLFGKYANYFQELKAEEEKLITDDDYAPYNLEGVKARVERSPKPAEELEKMSDEELLSFLNEWENVHHDPDKWWVHINFKGLAQAFQAIFREDASRFNFWIENKERIKRPIYVRAMVSAIHEYVKSKQFIMLDQWLNFCEWILLQPDQSKEKDVNRSDESREHPDWLSSRRAVGDFVGMCLTKEVNIPVTARECLVSLLDKLCTQYDRRLDDNEHVLLNGDDPLTEAINNTRSRALENLVDFSYWVRRQLDDNQAKVPEVTSILNKRISPECKFPLTLPEYALLGMLYGLIYDLDPDWASQHKVSFFPQNNFPAWVEAFGNFLRMSSPYKPTFDMLRDDFEFAIENVKNFKTSDNQRYNFIDLLGKLLFELYLWRVYPLTGGDSLLERFYEKTKDDKNRWARLFHYVGRFLSNSGRHLEEDLKQRIIEFFDWCFEKEDPLELREFTFWLGAECLDAEWRLTSFLNILNVLRPSELAGFSIGGQVYALRGMLEDHVALVVKCFVELTELAVKNDAIIHIRTDKARPILQAGLDSTDETVRADAERARENLLQWGRFDYLDMES